MSEVKALQDLGAARLSRPNCLLAKRETQPIIHHLKMVKSMHCPYPFQKPYKSQLVRDHRVRNSQGIHSSKVIFPSHNYLGYIHSDPGMGKQRRIPLTQGMETRSQWSYLQSVLDLPCPSLSLPLLTKPLVFTLESQCPTCFRVLTE